jgi:hypothetical protein
MNVAKSRRRKIIVNEVEYLWNTNGVITKVAGVATRKSTVYENKDWATPYINPYFEDPNAERKWIVKPKDVRGMILGVRSWRDHQCSRHPNQIITGVCSSPYDKDIYGKVALMGNCLKCVDDEAMAI